MKRILLSIIMLLFITNLALGTDDPNTPDKNDELITIRDCVKLAQKCGDLIQKGMNETAFNLLHQEGYFVRTDFTINQRNAAYVNFEAMNEAVGKELGIPVFNGFEFVKVTRTGESVISVYFWSKHKYGPVAWRFMFYKPNDKWKFFDFSFGPQAVPEIFLISQPVEIQNVDAKKNK